MPIPILLGGGALIAAAIGAKKTIDANDKNKKAKKIVEDAQNRFKKATQKLEKEKNILNQNLEDFAKFKLLVFTTQIKNLVKLLKQCKDKANSHLNNENITFTPQEIKALEKSVSNALEIVSGMVKGVASGALIAFGAYSSVGFLASASTGTAISALSGAAAQNAILAWLGGGSLAAGGGGMALGTAVLSGLVAGPFIAITGLVLDSKAEKNLTQAYEYETDIDIKIKKMESSLEGFKIINRRIDELRNIIEEITIRFDYIFNKINNVGFIEKIKRYAGISNICGLPDLDKLIILGKNLKIALDIPLLDEDGNENENFDKEIKRITIS